MTTGLQQVILHRYTDNLPVQKQRQKSAFPPNFIHSIDSSHMMMTALECAKEGMSSAPMPAFLVHCRPLRHLSHFSTRPVVPQCSGMSARLSYVRLRRTSLCPCSKDIICHSISTKLAGIVAGRGGQVVVGAAAGLDFAGVHDSFWTHAGDVPRMNQILREQFVALHSQPILEELLAKFQVRPDRRLPPSPASCTVGAGVATAAVARRLLMQQSAVLHEAGPRNTPDAAMEKLERCAVRCGPWLRKKWNCRRRRSFHTSRFRKCRRGATSTSRRSRIPFTSSVEQGEFHF